jgi:hypothetical protein
MDRVAEIGYYKILYGLLKKYVQYKFNWKNMETYTTNYFRCLKRLKYEMGVAKLQTDSDIYELQLEEMKESANNIDKKVNNTIEEFLKCEKPEDSAKIKIITIIQICKQKSRDYFENYDKEQFEKYGFTTFLNNKSKN